MFGTRSFPPTADREIHVNGAVALAQWRYYLATGDLQWLREREFPVMVAVADFWSSRASYDSARHRFVLLDVNSPEEDYIDVNNEIYANEVAHQSLSVATTSSGFIEAFPYGLSGLRVEEQGLVPEFAPTLPRELSNLKLVNIAFRGQLFDLSISRLPSGQVVRRMAARDSIH